MKVLITGVAGFIGSNLAEYLLEKGYEVIGVDNFNDYYAPKVKEFNISSFKNHHKFKLYSIDITDRNKLESVFDNENPYSVVHLAAWAGVTPSLKRPEIYAHANYCGTNNLAEFACHYGVKTFVFASTSSVYGNENKTPFKEEMDTSYPAAPYPASKKAGEVLLYTYWLNFKLDIAVLRFFNPIGPKLRPDMALPKLIRSVEFGEKFGLYQNPESSARDYTYIEHMLQAIEKAINKPLGYEIMNLGNSNPVTLVDMLNTVEKVTGKEVQVYEEPRAGQMEITFADITKAKKLLGYNPSTTLEEMVKIYYDWFLKQPDWYQKGKSE